MCANTGQRTLEKEFNGDKGRAAQGRGRHSLGDAQAGGRAPVHAKGGWAFFVCLGMLGGLKKMTE